jgi:hypothetical protein
MFKPIPFFKAAAVAAVMFAATMAAEAQLIYSQDFSTDDSTNWVVNFSDAGSNYVNFNFDYSTVGLPPAPHSVGGNTKGLKLSPDVTVGALLNGAAVPGVSVTPTNFSITANFDMHVDMWINYQGPNTANIVGGTATNAFTTLQTGGGGSGSTLLYGCGYGTAGNSAQVAGACDSILVGTTTDNGTSAEMRMYGPSGIGQASYQNGVYQSTGTATPSFPGEPFVYANPSGTRAFYTQSTWTSVPSPNWTNFFPSVKPPQAQLNLYRQQTNIQSVLGSISFGWHDVEVQKIGNVIVYLIDGHLAATGNYLSAGTPAGDKLVFTAFDINSTISTDPNFVALNFVVFANITVSNLVNVVNVTAPVQSTTEGSPGSPAMFTLTRSSSGVPLTVNYTLGGTATNGVQYQTIPLSVTFAADATDTNIFVVPIDDGIPRLTTSVILNLQSGPGYAGAGNAVINIFDNDPTTVDVSNTSQAYGRYSNPVDGTGNNDFVPFAVTRRGKLTTGADLTVNISYGGAAVAGTDFIPVTTVTIPDGVATNQFLVRPLDNGAITTNRSLTAAVIAGTGYVPGTNSASGTIVSAHYNPAPIIYTNDLTSVDDATNWVIRYGTGDPLDDFANYSVDFGLPLNATPGGFVVPPPPGGNASALHLTVNKQNSTSPAPGAVNVYLTNVLLSGNYAVRFNMNLIEGSVNATATEGAIFGINHTGSDSNWWYGSGFLTNATWSSDGIWYFVTAQAGGASTGDYQEFTGLGGTNGNTGWTRITSAAQSTFAQAFKDNPGPFTALDGFSIQSSGVPANGSQTLGYDQSTWVDVEIKQQDNVVTLSINHTKIFSYTNTTVWKSGYLMLGYSDPFGGGALGTQDAGVYYANLQIVQGPTVHVDSIAIVPGVSTNTVLTFTSSGTGDVPSAFSVLSSTNIISTFSGVSSTIIPLTTNQFQATTPYVGGAQRFYKVIHN